jgi:GNAT superfamily N-acetyltransferase
LSRRISASFDPVRIRDARLADARDMAEVHVRSWQVAYRGLFPDEHLDALDPSQREAWRMRMLDSLPGDRASLVVEERGVVVAFADVGPAGWVEGAVDGELYAIYLHPAMWGRGLGRALLGAAEVRLAELGHDAAVLWVLDGNLRARRFYEAAGWSPDGPRRVEPVWGVDANEVRYRSPRLRA